MAGEVCFSRSGRVGMLAICCRGEIIIAVPSSCMQHISSLATNFAHENLPGDLGWTGRVGRGRGRVEVVRDGHLRFHRKGSVAGWCETRHLDIGDVCLLDSPIYMETNGHGGVVCGVSCE